MVSPTVPGLNDSDIPSVLEAAKEAGAQFASRILLRLPLTVEPVFLEWLQTIRRTHHNKVVSLIKQSGSGELNNAECGDRTDCRKNLGSVHHFRQKRRVGWKTAPAEPWLFPATRITRWADATVLKQAAWRAHCRLAALDRVMGVVSTEGRRAPVLRLLQ